MQATPLILITNDDGIHSQGLIELKKTMETLGDAYIIAPDRERSAVSHALTLHKPLRVEQRDEKIFTVNGTPTDCVALGILKILHRKPDIIVAGINKGANLGDDITYSGTVAAAIEGTILNVPSFAISLFGDKPFHYESATPFAIDIVKYIIENSLLYDTLLNVNIPNLPLDKIKGLRFTKQSKRIYDNAIQEIYSPVGDKHYWIGGGQPLWERGDDLDIQTVVDKFVSVTPLHLDLTNYKALEYLRRLWKQKR